MTYILEGPLNRKAAEALRGAGYDGNNAILALSAWKSQIPRFGNGTSPLKWGGNEIWIPYRWLDRRRVEIELEASGSA